MKTKKIPGIVMTAVVVIVMLMVSPLGAKATTTIADFESYTGWTDATVIATASFEDNGLIYAYTTDTSADIYSYVRGGYHYIGFGSGDATTAATVTITRSDNADFRLRAFSYLNLDIAQASEGLKITAYLDGSEIYHNTVTCAESESGTVTMDDISDQFGCVDQIEITYFGTNAALLSQFIFGSFTYDAVALVAPSVALSSPDTGSGLNYSITDSNTEGTVSGYQIQLYNESGTSAVGSPISVSSLTGTIPLSADVSAGTGYTAKVMAVSANTANFSDSVYGTLSSSATARMKTVLAIAVTSDPTDLDYVVGQTLDLSGMKVTLTYDDDSTVTDITYDQFATYSIAVNYENGATLSLSDDGAVIQVTCNLHTAEASAPMNVAVRGVSAISITSDPLTMSYYAGYALDLSGMLVDLTYNDGSVVNDVTPALFGDYGIVASPADAAVLTVGNDGLAVFISCNGVSAHTAGTLTVIPIAAVSVEITSEPTKLAYYEGQTLDLSGMTVTLTYNDATVVAGITSDQFTSKGITSVPSYGNALVLADNAIAITVSCDGQSDVTSGTLQVLAMVVTGIQIETDPSDLSYYSGQSLNLKGMSVNLSYSDGSSVGGITPDLFAIKGITASPADGTMLSITNHAKPITVSVGAFSDTTANLTVVVRNYSSSTIQNNPTEPQTEIPAYLTDPNSGIIFDLSGAQFAPEVTSVTVAVTAQTQDSSLIESLRNIFESGSFGDVEAIALSDLSLYDQNGMKITSFTGTVKIKIPIPQGFDGDLHVYCYDPDGGTLTDMKAYIVGDYLVFETNHFSYYAVVQFAETVLPAASNATWISRNAVYVLIGVFLALFITMGVAISRRKKSMA